MERKGITAAGNWIVDKPKIIDDFPPQDGLCNILEESASNGGGPYNLLKDLAKMKVSFPLQGIGVIGEDDAGAFILHDCVNHQIDKTFITKTTEKGTSYTDVMTSGKTGRRTFFHYRGANSLLDIHHFPVEKISSKIFYLGYLLLLDQLDMPTNDNLTKAAILLQNIQQSGMRTAVDIVSENSDRFTKIVPPALPFIDYLFVNEYEASKITGLQASEKLEDMELAGKELLNMGVKTQVFIHAPHGAVSVRNDGEITTQASLNVPNEFIKGSAGAGDAFAAGVLHGLHEGKSTQEMLEAGVCIAAASLRHPSCSEMVVSLGESFSLAKKYGYRVMK